MIELSAAEAIQKIRDGEITSEELVGACLERIDQVDGEVEAWAHLSPDFALEQARACDAQRRAGEPLGPLHGLPVGVKDIFDTKDYPTENGTVLNSGRQPFKDCRVISLLKEAGAVIFGKTVTTELAVYGPGKTKNPHNPKHTPGGSSSGSAAAVASYMVPLAVGTQTNGSTLRPASFCGVVGFKPSHGLIPRTGVLLQSPPLDTVGTFARSIEDVALLTETLIAFDSGDSSTRPRPRPALRATALEEPPMEPIFVFSQTPVWDQAEDYTKEAFGELVDALGDDCGKFELPEPFDQVVTMHRKIMCADLAKNFARYYERGKDKLTDTLCKMIEEGRTVSAVDYNNAMDLRAALNSELDTAFENFDAIITPSTQGEAPAGLDATGNPIFNTIWTFCGTPAINLPLMEGPNGLPLGVQLVGQRGDDARLLRAANWLSKRIAADA